MTELVERVARAICKADCMQVRLLTGFSGYCEACDEWQSRIEHARAAIEAMREPTGAMLAAMDGWADLVCGDAGPDSGGTAEMRAEEFLIAWRAAIDAALGKP